MTNTFYSDSFVPPHPEVPAETHVRVQLGVLAEHQQKLKMMAKKAAKMDAISGQYPQELGKVIDQKKYAQLQKYFAEVLARRAENLLPPKGLELSIEQIDELDRKRKDEAQAFIRKLGIDPEDLHTLNRGFHSRLRKVAAKDPEHKKTPGKVMAGSDVPPAIRHYKTNPWTLRRPPYEGWNQFRFISQNSNGLNFVDQMPWTTDYINPVAGEVGSRFNVYHLSDAEVGDNDTANVRWYSAVGFWYRMPTAGLIEAWVEAQSVVSRHFLRLENLWGISDSSTDQNNFITLRAMEEGGFGHGSSDPESQALHSRMVWHSSEDRTLDLSFLRRGDIVFSHHFSESVFAADTWVWVQIGTFSTLDVFADDMLVDTTMDFKWFIKSVQIRSTGGE